MNKLYGITHSRICGYVIGFGNICICFNIYYGKAIKRLKGWCYKHDFDHILWQLYSNQDSFSILGFIKIDSKTKYDLTD